MVVVVILYVNKEVENYDIDLQTLKYSFKAKINNISSQKNRDNMDSEYINLINKFVKRLRQLLKSLIY